MKVSEKLWLFNHKKLIFGFQILDLKVHFSASLTTPGQIPAFRYYPGPGLEMGFLDTFRSFVQEFLRFFPSI